MLLQLPHQVIMRVTGKHEHRVRGFREKELKTCVGGSELVWHREHSQKRKAKHLASLQVLAHQAPKPDERPGWGPMGKCSGYHCQATGARIEQAGKGFSRFGQTQRHFQEDHTEEMAQVQDAFPLQFSGEVVYGLTWNALAPTCAPTDTKLESGGMFENGNKEDKERGYQQESGALGRRLHKFWDKHAARAANLSVLFWYIIMHRSEGFSAIWEHVVEHVDVLLLDVFEDQISTQTWETFAKNHNRPEDRVEFQY